jgi:CDP-4-dehydro-6-deoxyglucose reductase, E1
VNIRSGLNNMYKIRYGGSVCDDREYKAVMKSVKESIKSGGWQAGRQATLMEEEASKFLGVKHGILTTSGSCAGLLALSALELPRASEVIIPAVTFPTIFNIILQCGLTPVVVDSKIGSYNLDVDEVEKAITPKTKAIIAVHALGNPVDMPKLMKIIKKFKRKIYVIEDNCDGWGTTIGNRKVGSFGHISITSFHAAHIVSMGVGGGVFTSDTGLARKVRMYRDWGRQADVNESENKKWKTLPKDYNPRFIYEKVGYNFQILELQAAMGRVQLKKTEKIKRMRKTNFDYLYKHLKKYSDYLVLPKWLPEADVCWFAFPLSVQNHTDRGSLLKHLEKNGIETRPMFAGNITRHPAYAGMNHKQFRIYGGGYFRSSYPESLRGAEKILTNSFWIGVHPRQTKEDNDYIIKTFDDFFA